MANPFGSMDTGSDDTSYTLRGGLFGDETQDDIGPNVNPDRGDPNPQVSFASGTPGTANPTTEQTVPTPRGSILRGKTADPDGTTLPSAGSRGNAPQQTPVHNDTELAKVGWVYKYILGVKNRNEVILQKFHDLRIDSIQDLCTLSYEEIDDLAGVIPRIYRVKLKAFLSYVKLSQAINNRWT